MYAGRQKSSKIQKESLSNRKARKKRNLTGQSDINSRDLRTNEQHIRLQATKDVYIHSGYRTLVEVAEWERYYNI